MLKGITRILSGDPLAKQMEHYDGIVAQINPLEPGLQVLSDEQLRGKTAEFRGRLEAGETLDDLLPEAFAVVREASVRTLGLRHFDVQLVGAIALHEGKIVEMKTGEGKTLVATLPIYLNALTGRGVHLVTVNDYLARRDARWMGPIYHFLGMQVGVLQEAARTEHGQKAFLYDPERQSGQEDVHQLQLVDRQLAYGADVVYGTNNEFGFDYLRDNMAQTLEARSQRGHHYAILDEVDNILIDEARTPLIISGPSHEDPELYLQMAQVVKQLDAEDFEISERDRNISLTEIGEDHVERLLGQPMRDPDRPEDISPEQARLLGFLEQALRAEYLFKRNKDYVVQGGRVIIVDEFTGRMMTGRRWSDGLHQAVEAKEGVRVREENVTYATITLQNYFRKYEKLAGMTGTAVTEAEEFSKIYSVDVIPLPTNLEYIASQPETPLLEVEYRENGSRFHYYARPDDEARQPVFWRRKDYPDVVYRTEEAKLRAVTLEILRRQVLGQPLLVGTTSVELSEKLSGRLRAEPLQRLVMIQLLRDAYLEAHDLQDDGMRVEAVQELYAPLEQLSPAELRAFARELELSLNPTRPENLGRAADLLGLEPEHQERLLEALQAGIRHNVLNAKKHAEESQIIASAGGFGAVTIATNMAGRGVDIKLGGELPEEVLGTVNRVLRRAGQADPEMLNMDERLQALEAVDAETVGIYQEEIDHFRHFMQEQDLVRAAGGLHVIGSERHEARRIDNQLRGRAARQGDPGSSQFFLSLQDELMRLFGGAQVSGLMERLKIDDATPIAHGIVNKTIEQSQGRVEGANFDRRKHLLEYDDVLNQQREIFYGQRNRLFVKEDLSQDLEQMLRTEVEGHVKTALEDAEGPWRLLAWLEEIQPTLALETEQPYPSFMLRLLLQQLEGLEDPQALRAELVRIATRSLETQLEHTARSTEEQLYRSAERLRDQVRQRVDLADMAIEAALLEAEQGEAEPDPRALLGAVESAAGLRIQTNGAVRDQIQADPASFRDRVPELIEASLGLRVWAGLAQTAERRLGQTMNLPPQLPAPIDWDSAAELLANEIQRAGRARLAQQVDELERELAARLGQGESRGMAHRIRLLVGMSYSQQTFFDRRTHQRREVIVPRLSYAFYAAELLANAALDELVEQVLEHLAGARQALQGFVGAEALTEYHRRLFLHVGDRLWVEYLTQMEALRTSIGLEAYGQRDPLVQYKSRAVDMFRGLLDSIRAGVVARVFQLSAPQRAAVQVASPARPAQAPGPSGEDSGAGKRKRRRRRR
jgi:preprotein translocase subunit SecA